MATIQSIEISVPPHSLTNVEAAEVLAPYFAKAGEDPQTLHQIFTNAAIHRRFLAKPVEFYLNHQSLTERNQVYTEVACEIGLQASRNAIATAGLEAQDIDVIIDTSCTGIMIPSLDAYVINALGMRKDVRRLPFTSIGCAGGAVALSRAHDYLKAYPDANVLILCTELPSLTAQLGDTSRANLVSTAIFGDGAAAVVVSNRPATKASFEVLQTKSVLFPHSEDIMGFNLQTEGFRIILSPRIPILVRRKLRGEIDEFLSSRGLSVNDLSFHVLHPGGTKVLDNLRNVFEVGEEQVAESRACLRDYGNLSSASVLFVARQVLQRPPFKHGDYGFLCAMGPGFALEMALLSGIQPQS